MPEIDLRKLLIQDRILLKIKHFKIMKRSNRILRSIKICLLGKGKTYYQHSLYLLTICDFLLKRI